MIEWKKGEALIRIEATHLGDTGLFVHLDVGAHASVMWCVSVDGCLLTKPASRRSAMAAARRLAELPIDWTAGADAIRRQLIDDVELMGQFIKAGGLG